MNLDINVLEEKDQVVIAYISGEIDIHTATKLQEALLPLTEKSEHMIEIDLENVNYMDSTGLGVFISVLKSTKKYNSAFRLVNLQQRVARLFKITGLDEVIDISSSIRGGK